MNYRSAGTVEFLVDHEGNHYFIEMNPRIQVEHTVTEMTTGIDIVQSQILIAEGYEPGFSRRLDIQSQDDIQPRGFAIQCRLTTEDPINGFAPDTGVITKYTSAGGYGIRLDAGNAFVKLDHLAVLRQPSCKSNVLGAQLPRCDQQGKACAEGNEDQRGEDKPCIPAQRTESPDVPELVTATPDLSQTIRS